MSINTDCWYNPTTNKLITNTMSAPEDYHCLGCRKVAEAFTATKPKDWPILWENRVGGIIKIKNLPSKLKHKMKKLGITEDYD